MKSIFTRLMVAFLLVILTSPLYGQLTDADIAALQQRAKTEGWTFTVGRNPATERPLRELAGSVEPPGLAPPPTIDAASLQTTLPTYWDWRERNGVTPIKDQGACGSCWAFGTVAVVESIIMIKDGWEEDFSEQWLVSCTDAGTCDGGFHGLALPYFLWDIDPCGDSGAVFEWEFPYEAADLACDCPYYHAYWIDSWGYVAANNYYYSTPNVLAIKQAIIEYGPVVVSVYVDAAFQAYNGGVFDPVNSYFGSNHCVALVGWDDSQGTNGVWFMKNSWGQGWGEDGYMRIGFGCNNIGYRAAYVDYFGTASTRVVPQAGFYSVMEEGGPVFPRTKTFMVINNSSRTLQWTAASSQTWVDLNPTSGNIPAGDRRPIEVTLNDEAYRLDLGEYEDTLVITDLGTGTVIEREIRLSVVEKRPAAVMTIIEPQEVAESGAQWRIVNADEPRWMNSGEIATDLFVGNYDLECSDVEGWFTPTQIQVTTEQMVSQQITVVRAVYTSEIGGSFTAVAGADQTVSADNAVVTLNGKATGGVRPYMFDWSVAHRPPGAGSVTFSKMTSVNAYPAYLATIGGDPVVAGDYVMRLTVTDTRGLVQTDTLTVTVLEGSSTGTSAADVTPTLPTNNPTGNQTPTENETPSARSCGTGGGQTLAMTFAGMLLILFISRRRLL